MGQILEYLKRIDEKKIHNIKLDKKDKKILSILSKNSRLPLTRVRKEVMLSRDGIDYRIKRLVDKNVILKFSPLINYRSLGYYDFHVFIIIALSS